MLSQVKIPSPTPTPPSLILKWLAPIKKPMIFNFMMGKYINLCISEHITSFNVQRYRHIMVSLTTNRHITGVVLATNCISNNYSISSFNTSTTSHNHSIRVFLHFECLITLICYASVLQWINFIFQNLMIFHLYISFAFRSLHPDPYNFISE